MNPIDNGQRTFTLAYGVKLPRDPDTLTKAELVEELYSLADFASAKIIEARTLHRVLDRKFDGK